jgi:hypothetical protein
VKRTIPTIWGIIIIVLVAALVYFIWQGSFWKQVAEGKRPVPGKTLTGVAPPKEVLEPSAAPQSRGGDVARPRSRPQGPP